MIDREQRVSHEGRRTGQRGDWCRKQRQEMQKEGERAGVAGGPFILQHTPATLAMAGDDTSSY